MKFINHTIYKNVFKVALALMFFSPSFKSSAMYSLVSSTGPKTIGEGLYWGSLGAYQLSLYNGSQEYLKNSKSLDILPSVAVRKAIQSFNRKTDSKNHQIPKNLQFINVNAGLSPAALKNSLCIPMTNEDYLITKLQSLEQDQTVTKEEIEILKQYQDQKKDFILDLCKKLNLTINDILPDAEISGLSPHGPQKAFKCSLKHEIAHLYYNHPIKMQLAPFVSWGLIALSDFALRKTPLNNAIERHPYITTTIKSAAAYLATKLYNQYAEIQADNEVINRTKKPDHLKKYAAALESSYKIDKANIKLSYPRFGKLLDSYPGLYQFVNRDHPHPLWRAKRINAAAATLENNNL